MRLSEYLRKRADEITAGTEGAPRMGERPPGPLQTSGPAIPEETDPRVRAPLRIDRTGKGVDVSQTGIIGGGGSGACGASQNLA